MIDKKWLIVADVEHGLIRRLQMPTSSIINDVFVNHP